MTVRLTVAQATVRFLQAQQVERDGARHPFFTACWGIFGHGNVAGLGEALLGSGMRYLQGRNEQAMVHAAVGYARHRDRLAAHVVTSSVGPGATNMVTGAALATVNRLPVLLLPGDTFATRAADPVLQQLEHDGAGDVSVNDAFRPVSVYFDRVVRPAQLPAALLAATRVLTDPARTGAVTLALPQDVQAEAHDWPEDLFRERVWHIPRPVPEPAALARAVAVLRTARRPLLVAGGGTTYSDANAALAEFATRTGIPVAETQAGKGALPHGHPRSVGAVGATGGTAANRLAARADVVIGVGTRWSDFTTASRTLFAYPGVLFVNLNVAAPDAHKLSAVPLVADAREGLTALTRALEDWSADPDWTRWAGELTAEWDGVVTAAGALETSAQSGVIGAVNERSGPRDVVVCAAGSMPGDLHRLWRTRDRKGYHVEYGYSCMGYEIAGGLGVKLAVLDEDDDREVYVLVGDGSYLMMSSELVTAVAEGVKLVVVLVQNHGYASIGALSESVGSGRFGTRYRYRSEGGRRDGDRLPVDLAANAASLGADVFTVNGRAELEHALDKARRSARLTVIHVETDPLVGGPDGGAWWDVPVAGVSANPATRSARAGYERQKTAQRPYLRPSSPSGSSPIPVSIAEDE
ncbi:3D-(3,5/4)-trihydroxycyclohexane-1,2-dione acylhydrolase (decyclizing) [Kineosporia sp. J2-2]|uniref:3D-(3,5/4)-trihydroxycyclohexane-1,2-dione acylhydrolase (Decyclizing) n=1 Tax=Kineosporia corallincola TaxID=2835133 RepID=A0ABS5TNQ4_9ACTN|nr:3D-(3,5/4)-trihydroxycyclohexane-1,2-dione acylhydrolase (decyclizing) [Kineosporia corallincola]MBT0771688.1 3D-(3,5/4)-trihydroxycyclohexane-1,2-dione acylhydrolase (decyclizing) [Kineosporia corallincola]